MLNKKTVVLLLYVLLSIFKTTTLILHVTFSLIIQQKKQKNKLEHYENMPMQYTEIF